MIKKAKQIAENYNHRYMKSLGGTKVDAKDALTYEGENSWIFSKVYIDPEGGCGICERITKEEALKQIDEGKLKPIGELVYTEESDGYEDGRQIILRDISLNLERA